MPKPENEAAALLRAERYAEAETLCRDALRRQPGHWALLANLGQAVHGQNRPQDAAPIHIAAVNANPANPCAWNNTAICLRELGAIGPARAAADAAVRLAPANAHLHVTRAVTLLAANVLAEGFAEFEWRWRSPNLVPHGYDGLQWNGQPPEGRTILVHAEGGFGDALQFIRYVPLLAARGARVLLRVPDPLKRLFARSLGGAATLLPGGTSPPYDFHCPLLSLPHAFGTSAETVPAEIPYLQADPARAAAAQAALAHLPGHRVGLVWRGSPLLGRPEFRAMNGRRSLPPALLAPLAAIPGISLVSLQHDEAPPPGLPIHDPMASVTDFDDTAAIIAALDLVIGVDTAVIHLAGALGRPVWLLSRHDPCWRWPLGHTGSAWYPTLRHYWQTAPGDWLGVIARVAKDLEAA